MGQFSREQVLDQDPSTSPFHVALITGIHHHASSQIPSLSTNFSLTYNFLYISLFLSQLPLSSLFIDPKYTQNGMKQIIITSPHIIVHIILLHGLFLKMSFYKFSLWAHISPRVTECCIPNGVG
jgi:hypothetical protein